MMRETLTDIVGTAGDVALDSYLGALFMTPVERKAWNQQVWPIFKARQQAYRDATERSAAWLKGAEGGWDDMNAAARLFNSKAVWSKSVRHSDYERISALVEARSAS